MFECFHPTLVLAQHIFNFNSIEELKFPSHIGSRSTEHKNRLEAVQRRFPSHIGSRSTKNTAAGGLMNLKKFPSHIGSRSTWTPLRFGGPKPRFHPTLVLAQR